ncbi:MAG TPA: hypothetical protein VGP87_16575 [Gemmatimonadales bacterium]|jgi:hypothetical protein|nr:hypothetical protein [Gemmatimonadales bacterium]
MRHLFPIAVVLAACPSPSTGVPLEQDFDLRPGQSVGIAGTGQTVTFEAVPEDSRCPTGVVCVWAGNARVNLRIHRAGRDTSVALNTGIEPKAVTLDAVRLELKDVTPVPHAGMRTQAGDYRITLRATGPR